MCLSLFSSEVNVVEKKILCKTLLKQNMLSQPRNQNIPVVAYATYLKDLVGQDSWTLIQLLATTFLRKSSAASVKNDDYINSCKKVMNLVVVNDACEKKL